MICLHVFATSPERYPVTSQLRQDELDGRTVLRWSAVAKRVNPNSSAVKEGLRVEISDCPGCQHMQPETRGGALWVIRDLEGTRLAAAKCEGLMNRSDR